MEEIDIKYMSYTLVKGQVIADLVVEFTKSPIKVEVEEQKLGAK